jgi:ornithine carbamoyltransferase
MKIRHVLSVADIGRNQLSYLVKRSLEMAHNGGKLGRPLHGKVVGIYFRGTSTRTRTAFTVGALKLGGSTIAYGPHDLQIATGETICDTARVLAGYLDVLVIRTNGVISEMRDFASQNEMAVINAMSENEHPTQAIADLTTIREEFGRLEGIHILYLGEGNNTAAALAFAVAQIPQMHLTIVTPEGYGLPASVIDESRRIAAESGSEIQQHHSMENLPAGVDVVYTTRWQTMGVAKVDPDWQSKFMPYGVTPAVMSRVSKGTKTVFLHDLPAVRGADVLDEVLDGPQSRAFRQARHKLHSAMSLLEWCLSAAKSAAV